MDTGHLKKTQRIKGPRHSLRLVSFANRVLFLKLMAGQKRKRPAAPAAALVHSHGDGL